MWFFRRRCRLFCVNYTQMLLRDTQTHAALEKSWLCALLIALWRNIKSLPAHVYVTRMSQWPSSVCGLRAVSPPVLTNEAQGCEGCIFQTADLDAGLPQFIQGIAPNSIIQWKKYDSLYVTQLHAYWGTWRNNSASFSFKIFDLLLTHLPCANQICSIQ